MKNLDLHHGYGGWEKQQGTDRPPPRLPAPCSLSSLTSSSQYHSDVSDNTLYTLAPIPPSLLPSRHRIQRQDKARGRARLGMQQATHALQVRRHEAEAVSKSQDLEGFGFWV